MSCEPRDRHDELCRVWTDDGPAGDDPEKDCDCRRPGENQLLSGREVEVLRLVALGYTNAAAAKELFLAEDTIKSHLTRIRARLQAKDRTQIVVTAIALGLLTPDYSGGRLEVWAVGQ